MAYETGRHVIGYEVDEVRAAVDWFRRQGEPERPVGVFGYGEGGLVALHAAAVDKRINAAWVAGYFGPREAVWSEPVYRNVWNLLRDFGDAEVRYRRRALPRSARSKACKGPRGRRPAPAGGRPERRRLGTADHPAARRRPGRVRSPDGDHLSGPGGSRAEARQGPGRFPPERRPQGRGRVPGRVGDRAGAGGLEAAPDRPPAERSRPRPDGPARRGDGRLYATSRPDLRASPRRLLVEGRPQVRQGVGGVDRAVSDPVLRGAYRRAAAGGGRGRGLHETGLRRAEVGRLRREDRGDRGHRRLGRPPAAEGPEAGER